MFKFFLDRIPKSSTENTSSVIAVDYILHLHEAHDLNMISTQIKSWGLFDEKQSLDALLEGTYRLNDPVSIVVIHHGINSAEVRSFFDKLSNVSNVIVREFNMKT